MFSFAYPRLLWLLVLVPVLLALYVLSRRARRRNLRKFGQLRVLAPLMPEVSPYKPPLKITIGLAAVILLVVALARPWGGLKDEKSEKEGIEVIIAVDASNSMLASATAEPGGAQRMRTAKLMLEKLINRLDNDRVGLIVYAGGAYTLIPVTGDYVSAKMFLNSIDPAQISNQGTDMAGAIDLAVKSFGADKNVGKAIVMITDAEDLEDEKSVMDAAESAAKNRIQLDVIGVGSSTPMPVPLGDGSLLIDPSTGSPVQTALNEDLAAAVAKSGNGIYVNASNRDALNELEKQLDTVKKTALESSVYALHDELFGVFAWIALALLALDVFILDRKIGWLDRFTFFKKEDKA